MKLERKRATRQINIEVLLLQKQLQLDHFKGQRSVVATALYFALEGGYTNIYSGTCDATSTLKQ